MSVFDDFDTISSHVNGIDLCTSMRIGVPDVDRLHSELARLIERINEDPHALTSSESVTDLLGTLQNVLTNEFAIEEKLMVQTKVPTHQLAEHVREHTALLTLFVEASLDAMSPNPCTARQLYDAIKERVLEHTMQHDTQLG